MKFLSALAMMGCLYAPFAWSQCATGVDTGGGSCVPPEAPGMPGYQSNAQQPLTQQPQAIWADRWGAIVIAEDTGDAGTASGRASRSEAIEASMGDCSSHGAKRCKLELTYHNQCAAVAWGSSQHGTAGAPTESLAKSDAIQRCGEAACKIVYSGCSMAERIK